MKIFRCDMEHGDYLAVGEDQCGVVIVGVYEAAVNEGQDPACAFLNEEKLAALHACLGEHLARMRGEREAMPEPEVKAPPTYEELEERVRELEAERVDLLSETVRMLAHYDEDGLWDSQASGTCLDAMERLVASGRMEWVGERVGRRAFARFVERPTDV